MGWHFSHRGGPRERHEDWPGAQALCDEAGAFVRGHSAQLFSARHEPVPAWAWLNAPAHLTAIEVLDLAAQVRTGALGWRRWDAVPVTVAAALAVLSHGSPRAITRLQLERLQPLETALMDDDVHVEAPAELVHLAVLALRTGRRHCLT
jgi:hypothetical protein